MDLREFIKQTLTEIAAGVKDAQESVRASGGYANPAHDRRLRDSNEAHFGSLEDGQHVFLVDFDVAVCATDGEQAEAGAKVQIASIVNVGTQGGFEKSSSVTSRITFKVPLALPTDEVSTEELKKQKKKRKKANEEHARRSHLPIAPPVDPYLR